MFPTVRLLIVALLAAVVTLSCGLAVFATFGVDRHAFSRLPAQTAPLQLVADEAPSKRTMTWGTPLGSRRMPTPDRSRIQSDAADSPAVPALPPDATSAMLTPPAGAAPATLANPSISAATPDAATAGAQGSLPAAPPTPDQAVSLDAPRGALANQTSAPQPASPPQTAGAVASRNAGPENPKSDQATSRQAKSDQGRSDASTLAGATSEEAESGNVTGATPNRARAAVAPRDAPAPTAEQRGPSDASGTVATGAAATPDTAKVRPGSHQATSAPTPHKPARRSVERRRLAARAIRRRKAAAARVARDSFDHPIFATGFPIEQRPRPRPFRTTERFGGPRNSLTSQADY